MGPKTPDTKVRLAALAALFLLLGMAVAVPGSEVIAPDELTLADYARLSDGARLDFAQIYAADGARDLRDFLDAHVAQIRADTADRRARDARLDVKAATVAATGARILQKQ